MRNKILFLIIAGMFLLSLIAGASATNIAYVVKDTARLNPQFINVINELGIDYEVIDDSLIGITNFSGNNIIIRGFKKHENEE